MFQWKEFAMLPMVYQPNCCCRSKNCWSKFGLLFIPLPVPVLLRKYVNFWSILRVLSIFNVQEQYFYQLWGLRHPGVESNQYQLSTSHGSQQSNFFTTQLGHFDYFTLTKSPEFGNGAYYYFIKIGLLWSCLLQARSLICCSLVPWNFGNTESLYPVR